MESEIKTVVKCEYDRNRVWDRVQSRKAAFLDSNIWIDMADGKKEEAQILRARLIKHVQVGNLFCPLGTSIIWELQKQESSKMRTAELMETLSLNVCFVPTFDVFKWEVESFAKRLGNHEDEGDQRKMLFVPVAGYLESSFNVKIPDALPNVAIHGFVKQHCDRRNNLSLSELLKLRDHNPTDDLCRFLKQLPPTPYQKQVQADRALANGNQDKLKRIQEVRVFENVLVPLIEALPISLQALVIGFARNSPRDEHDGCMRTLIPELPAIRNYIEVMACISGDPSRKDRQSDFFDLDILPVSFAYADVFVSQDKRIRDMLKNRCELLNQNTCEFCSSYDEFNKWLNAWN